MGFPSGSVSVAINLSPLTWAIGVYLGTGPDQLLLDPLDVVDVPNSRPDWTRYPSPRRPLDRCRDIERLRVLAVHPVPGQAQPTQLLEVGASVLPAQGGHHHLRGRWVGSYDDLLADLGPHTTGVGCIYVRELESLDLDVLSRIVARSYEALTGGKAGTGGDPTRVVRRRAHLAG